MTTIEWDIYVCICVCWLFVKSKYDILSYGMTFCVHLKNFTAIMRKPISADVLNYM